MSRRAVLQALAGTVAAGAALSLSRPRGALAAAGPDGALLRELREGGCLLLIRHANTEPGLGDPAGFRLDDCRTQRNLSEDGRRQAQSLGDVLRRADVPIGPVRSSRWCRCIDTAQLAFGRVEPWPALDSFFSDRAAEPARTRELRDWALAFRGPGNAALVTHQVNITALVGPVPAMGEVIALRSADGKLRPIGRFAS